MKNTEGLSDRERLTVKQGFADFDLDEPDSRVTHFLYSTGAHPEVPANPTIWDLTLGPDVITWKRPKTWALAGAPRDPTMNPWIQTELSGWRQVSRNRVSINHQVHRFGRLLGLPLLCPRILRHDFLDRLVVTVGVEKASWISGTSVQTLMGYARRRTVHDVAKAIPEGLF